MLSDNYYKKSYKGKKIVAALISLGLITGTGCVTNSLSKNDKRKELNVQTQAYSTTNYRYLSENTSSVQSKINNSNYMKVCVDNAVDNLCTLYKELNLDSPIEIFRVYCELLKKGILSKNSTYTTKDVDDDKYEMYLGYTLFNGSGVCRNMDDLFCRSLKKIGYNAYSVVCYLTDEKKDKDYANHQVTIVNYNNCIYLLDVTNEIVFDNINSKDLYINVQNTYNRDYIYLHPKYSVDGNGYFCSYITQNELNTINNWLKNDSYSISKEYVDSEINNGNKKLNNDTYGAVKRFSSNMRQNVFANMK